MARNVVKRDHHPVSTSAEEPEAKKEDTADKAAMLGGTSGEPPDPNPPRMHIGIADVMPARQTEATPLDVPPVKRFEVIAAPPTVMYDGQRVQMHVGKVYHEHMVDLEYLRKQGVQFREIEA